MRPALPLACILLTCSSLAFGAPTENAPSPRALVESWKAGASAFARKVHSYRLQGRETVTVSVVEPINGHSSVGQTWTWRTVKQNGQYHSMQDKHSPEPSAFSNDGLNWYRYDYGQHPPRAVMVTDREAAATRLQEQTHPLTLEAFMNSPGICPGETPLQDQFLAQPQKLRLIGTETIGGKFCYHLHSSAIVESRMPADVWLTRQGRYFVPWQTLTSRGIAPFHAIMVVQAGATLDGLWYPTACRCRISEDDMRQPWKSYDETVKTFAITDINKATGSKAHPATHAR